MIAASNGCDREAEFRVENQLALYHPMSNLVWPCASFHHGKRCSEELAQFHMMQTGLHSGS